ILRILRPSAFSHSLDPQLTFDGDFGTVLNNERRTKQPMRRLTVSGAPTAPCIELADPEDTHRHFRMGSHIWSII
ncbi:MAG: hypothetical protein WBD49_20445, partial [Bradyrhizobium sp.]